MRIAVGEWPPYISESLPNQGFLCEVVRQAFAEEGLDVSFHFYSWAEAYRLTLEGRYVVTMPWFRSREREQLFYLSASLGHFTTRLMTLTGTPAVNLGELKHEPVGVTRGYFYGDGFAARQAGLTLEWSDSDEQSMGKLLDGRIHYLVMDEQVAQTAVPAGARSSSPIAVTDRCRRPHLVATGIPADAQGRSRGAPSDAAVQYRPAQAGALGAPSQALESVSHGCVLRAGPLS